MRLFFNLFILSFVLLFSIGKAAAQDRDTVEMPILFTIPAIALIDFAGTDARITFTPGNGAEQIITPSTLDKTWINYSSIVEGKSTNSIAVCLSSGYMPAAVKINLEVGQDIGAGAGTIGKPVKQIVLTPYPQEIITGIGSCYTGRGVQKGHQLTYSWEWMPPYDYDHSSIDKIEISVTYTFASAK